MAWCLFIRYEVKEFSNEQTLTGANKREGMKLKYQQRTGTNKNVNCLSEDSYSFTYEESHGFSFSFTSWFRMNNKDLILIWRKNGKNN